MSKDKDAPLDLLTVPRSLVGHADSLLSLAASRGPGAVTREVRNEMNDVSGKLRRLSEVSPVPISTPSTELDLSAIQARLGTLAYRFSSDARIDIPALLAEVRRLLAENASLTVEVERLKAANFSEVLQSAFITCESSPGNYFVKIKFRSQEEAQTLHSVLCRVERLKEKVGE